MDNKFDEANPLPNVNATLDNTELQYHHSNLAMKTPINDIIPTPISDDPLDDAYETEGDDEKIGNFTDEEMVISKSTETENLLQHNTYQTNKCMDNDSYCIDKCNIAFKQYELNEQGERIYSISIIINIIKQLVKRKIKQLGRDNKEYIEQMYDSIHSEIKQQRINDIIQPKVYYFPPMIAICFIFIFGLVFNSYQQMQVNIELNNKLNNMEQMFKQNQSAFETVILTEFNDMSDKITSVSDAVNILQSQLTTQSENISTLHSIHESDAIFMRQHIKELNTSNNEQRDALFSIFMIIWSVLGVFVLDKVRGAYYKNRFNNRCCLVNINDFARDEFLNAHYVKPNHAIKKSVDDSDYSCHSVQSLEGQGSGIKLVGYQTSHSQNSQSINADVSCNHEYKEDSYDFDDNNDDISPDMDEILNSYEYNYDSFEISEMEEDYDSSPSLLYTPNINAKTVQGSGSGSGSESQTNNSHNSQTSQSTNTNNTTQNTSTTRGYIPPSGNENGDGNDPNKRRNNNIEPTCGDEYKITLKETKKKAIYNKNQNDNQTPKMYKSKSAPTPTIKHQTKSTLDATAMSWTTNCCSIWYAPDLYTITETPETPMIMDTIQLPNHILNCTDDAIILDSTEKKGEESPKLSPIQKRKGKTKYKTTQYRPHNWSYEPDNSIRGQGNVFINKKMKRIIVEKIKERIVDIHGYIDYWIAINDGKIFDTINGIIKIFNINVHDKNTNKIIYCVAEQFMDRGYKWKINNIMTADEISHTFSRIYEDNLPICDNIFEINEKHKNIIKHIIVKKFKKVKKRKRGKKENIINIKKMFRAAQWQNDEIIGVFGKMSKRDYKFKRNLTLSLERMEFIKQLEEYIDNNNLNDIHLIPIVMFKNKQYGIHYVWKIQIDCDNENINIGISFQCQGKNNVVITGIHCDKNCLLQQHQLILPETDEHKCDCFDDFRSNITHLKVEANPDNKYWRDKYTKIKRTVRSFTDNGKNNFVYDIFCQEVKLL